MRREFRATCGCPNIFCHKMITSGPILMFEVSIEPYWSAQHDRIFESGATAFLVAKIWPKRFIHIWVVWRATELKFGIYADYPKYITSTYFGTIMVIFSFYDLRATPKAGPCHLFNNGSIFKFKESQWPYCPTWQNRIICYQQVVPSQWSRMELNR